ncbi:hypothetical protein S245_043994, partial [Arachis hypogaea]
EIQNPVNHVIQCARSLHQPSKSRKELRGKFGLVAFFFFCFFNCAAVFGFRDKILLGVMDDDLLLMVRSGFAVAAVPVLGSGKTTTLSQLQAFNNSSVLTYY